MKNFRIELRLVALIHVGEDVHEGQTPERAPDAVHEVSLVRVAHLGERVPAREAVAGHFSNLVANAVPVQAERIRHLLREKGL